MNNITIPEFTSVPPVLHESSSHQNSAVVVVNVRVITSGRDCADPLTALFIQALYTLDPVGRLWNKSSPQSCGRRVVQRKTFTVLQRSLKHPDALDNANVRGFLPVKTVDSSANRQGRIKHTIRILKSRYGIHNFATANSAWGIAGFFR